MAALPHVPVPVTGGLKGRRARDTGNHTDSGASRVPQRPYGRGRTARGGGRGGCTPGVTRVLVHFVSAIRIYTCIAFKRVFHSFIHSFIRRFSFSVLHLLYITVSFTPS